MADTYISAMMTNPGTILPQIPIPTILRTLQIHQNYSRHHIYPTRNTNTITSATKPTRCHNYITITWYIQYYLRNASIRCTWNTTTTGNTPRNTNRDSTTNKYAIIRKKNALNGGEATLTMKRQTQNTNESK